MIDNKKLWEDAMTAIELEVSKANFSTWFKNTFISKQEDNTIYLAVPNAFVRDWLSNKYHKLILKALRDISPNARGVEYVIYKDWEKGKEQKQETPKQIPTPQLKLNEIYINRESNLNPKYTFDNFIVGEFNNLAYATAQSVMKTPGISYNPLLVFGGTGVGKTHLIQAVGNYIKQQNENAKVFYMTSEKYVGELLNALQSNTMNTFKEKYRKYEVLMVDDIQFLGGKDRSQEEFFHLFNSLYDNNKQLIFSADRHPKEIVDIEDRLRSRLLGGTIAQISKPDLESRLVILRAKLKNIGTTLPDDVLTYVAESVHDNIRELEGVLNTLICQAQFKNKELTIQEAKQLIKNNSSLQRNVSIKDVVKSVSDFYRVEEKLIYEKTRRREVVKPRQIVMFLCRENLNSSFPHIGQKLGGRDHTTVIHACDKVKNDCLKDENLSREIEEIKNQLFGSKTSV